MSHLCFFSIDAEGDAIDYFLVIGIVFFTLTGLFFLISLFMRRRVHHQQQQYHLHDATLTYSDLHKPAKALFSKRYRLTGKPDYIIKRKGSYIPVEVKSGAHHHPLPYHLLQLVAYCQLVEDTHHAFVPYGILVYPNQSFTIPFNPQRRFELETTIKEMRKKLTQKTLIRNHHNEQKCKYCSFRQVCTQKLV